jgi:hypothetical protein
VTSFSFALQNPAFGAAIEGSFNQQTYELEASLEVAPAAAAGPAGSSPYGAMTDLLEKLSEIAQQDGRKRITLIFDDPGALGVLGEKGSGFARGRGWRIRRVEVEEGGQSTKCRPRISSPRHVASTAACAPCTGPPPTPGYVSSWPNG